MNENLWKKAVDNEIESSVADSIPVITDGYLLRIDIGMRLLVSFVPTAALPTTTQATTEAYGIVHQALREALARMFSIHPELVTANADLEVLQAQQWPTPLYMEVQSPAILPGDDWRTPTAEEIEQAERNGQLLFQKNKPDATEPEEPDVDDVLDDILDRGDDDWEWDEDKYGKRPDNWGDGRGPEEPA